IHVLSFDKPTSNVKETGVLKEVGLELDVRYADRTLSIGANHSYVKQLSWELGAGVQCNNTSYAQYNCPATGAVAWTTNIPASNVTVNGFGNDLLNWSNHVTKIYSNYRITDRLSVFGAGRLFWGYNGNKDEATCAEDTQPIGNAIVAINLRRDSTSSRDHFRI